jgi:hypothetical protein
VKVYGTLDVPDAMAVAGHAINFPYWRDGDVCRLTLTVERFSYRTMIADEVMRELALKFEGTEPFEEKLALLRRMPGFEEAVER